MKKWLSILALAFIPFAYGANTADRVLTADLIEGVSAPRNYIKNSGAEVRVAPLTAYADAAGVSPVDGTGGSPTITCTRTTSSTIAGMGSFLITKDAANRQGQGCSYAFTVQSGDQTKVLHVSYDYVPGTGWVASDGAIPTASNSDTGMYLYDVTNAGLIDISPKQLTTGATYQGHFDGDFQVPYNSTSFRLIFHTQTTNATAWTFKFDNLDISRRIAPRGPPASDWKAYTPTLTSFGSTTDKNFFYRCVGDSMEVQGFFKTATTAATTAEISIPSGFAIDHSKLGSAVFTKVGFLVYSHTEAIYNDLLALIVDSADPDTVFISKTGSTGNTLPKDNGNVINNNDYVYVDFKIPILGWSSNTELSSDAAVRPVVFSATTTAGTSVGNTDTLIPFATTLWDSHGAWSTNTFTCPVSSKYSVQANLAFNGGTFNVDNFVNVKVYKNGVLYKMLGEFAAQAADTYSAKVHGNADVDCKAGDTLQIYAVSNNPTLTLNGVDNRNHVSIHAILGPSAIARQDPNTVNTYLSGNQSIASTSPVKVTFDTFNRNNYGSFVGGTFTSPFPCYAQIHFAMNASGGTVGDTVILRIYKNGASKFSLPYTTNAAGDTFGNIFGSTPLLPGDTIEFYVDSGTDNSWTVNGGDGVTWADISCQ